MDGQGQMAKTVGLVGPSVTDHPQLPALAKRITDEGKTLSFSSLRMETLTDELVDLILKSGQKTLTVAVDGPSERMRDVINKAATDDFIVEKCGFLTRKGILHLKIYSIIACHTKPMTTLNNSFVSLNGSRMFMLMNAEYTDELVGSRSV